MFASIYHARVFLCVYINSRKIASVCSAQAQADSSHDRFARWFFRLGAEYTLRGGGGGESSRWIDTVDVGEGRRRNPRRERVYFTPTLFYTVLHPFYATREKPRCHFQRHGGGKRVASILSVVEPLFLLPSAERKIWRIVLSFSGKERTSHLRKIIYRLYPSCLFTVEIVVSR